ncbi:MAG: FAD:protein FMN transferase [Vicinamibacterales bacterium]
MRTILAGVVLLAVLAACRTRATDPDLVEEARVAMGSALRISVWTTDREGAATAIAAAFTEFDRLESALSVWRPGSDVERLNAGAGGPAVAVGPDTRTVLRAARDASALTGGKFDITFGALSNVWKFDHDQDNRVPAPEAIAARLPFVDYEAVEIDEARGTARIARAGVRVHLGGIGKGYAMDRAAALLRDRGFQDFLIQAGGDLYAAGRRGDRAWRVGLADPRGAASESFATIELSDETFSTSGDYERFFEQDGVRYHHLLDPDTGQPARLCRSVTILAKSALQADWLSTGVFILGPEEGLALVERLPDVEAVIVTAANEVKVSSGLGQRLRLEREPTP